MIHKEVPRQDLPSWRPGAPWTELVWIDYLSTEGLPVPPLVAADVDHGWLVEGFVRGSLYSGTLTPGAVLRLVDSVVRIEAACEAAPADVRAFSAGKVEVDPRRERWIIARWLRDEALPALDGLVDAAFGGARPLLGPVDIRAENAIDTGDRAVLIDFAAMGEDYRERRIAGYAWTARPEPRCILGEEDYRTVERTLGPQAALRLAFFDFAHCAWALARTAAGGHASTRVRTARAGRKAGAERAAVAGGEAGADGDDDFSVRLLEREWLRPRIDDERVEAVRFGLRIL